MNECKIARLDLDLNRPSYKNEAVRCNLNFESYLAALIHYAKIGNSRMVYVLRFETSHPRIDDLTIVKDLFSTENGTDILFDFYSGLVHKEDLEPKYLSPGYLKYLPIYIRIFDDSLTRFKKAVSKNIKTIPLDVIGTFTNNSNNVLTRIVFER